MAFPTSPTEGQEHTEEGHIWVWKNWAWRYVRPAAVTEFPDDGLTETEAALALYLPGTTSDYVSTPDNAAYVASTGLDVRVALAAADWTPASAVRLAAQSGAAGQISWHLTLATTTGRPTLTLSTDGTATAAIAATVSPTVADGEPLALRAVWAVGGSVTFYTKPTTAASALRDLNSDNGWVQLGAVVTASVPEAALHNSTSALTFGGDSVVAGSPGKHFAAHFLVNGSGVAEFDARIPAVRQRDRFGRLWTQAGTANAFTR